MSTSTGVNVETKMKKLGDRFAQVGNQWVVYGVGGADGYKEVGPFATLDEANVCCEELQKMADAYNKQFGYSPYDHKESMYFITKQISISNKDAIIKDISDIIARDKKVKTVESTENVECFFSLVDPSTGEAKLRLLSHEGDKTSMTLVGLSEEDVETQELLKLEGATWGKFDDSHSGWCFPMVGAKEVCVNKFFKICDIINSKYSKIYRRHE